LEVLYVQYIFLYLPITKIPRDAVRPERVFLFLLRLLLFFIHQEVLVNII